MDARFAAALLFSFSGAACLALNDPTGGGGGGGSDLPADGGDGGSLDGGNRDAGIQQSPDGGTAGDIARFLDGGSYRQWKAEASAHPSLGPHGRMRVYVNDALYKSLKQGNTVHPLYSMAVQELLPASGTTPNGYTVMLKQNAVPLARWTYFRANVPGYTNLEYYGNDSNTCYGCHTGGVDSIRSSSNVFP